MISPPAFPVAVSHPEKGHQCAANEWQHPGLSQRAYFAAKAMQAFIAKINMRTDLSDADYCIICADKSVAMADALIARLSTEVAE